MRPSSQLSQTSSGPLTRNERVRGTDAAGERLRIMTPKSDSGVAVTKGLPLFFFFPHTHSLSLAYACPPYATPRPAHLRTLNLFFTDNHASLIVCVVHALLFPGDLPVVR
jgi:hypothetical protein